MGQSTMLISTRRSPITLTGKIAKQSSLLARKTMRLAQETDPDDFVHFMVEEMGFDLEDARKVAYNNWQEGGEPQQV